MMVQQGYAEVTRADAPEMMAYDGCKYREFAAVDYYRHYA
ncbi:hypothetical protein [Methylomonas albis]|jgi:hypothetical protein|nr:hypothetical protein [Methylomonas albis]